MTSRHFSSLRVELRVEQQNSSVSIADQAVPPPKFPVQLKGRKWLSGFDLPEMPKQALEPTIEMPLFLEADHSLNSSEEIADDFRFLLETHLHKNGAALLRGAGLTDANSFNDFIEKMKIDRLDYTGGSSVRTSVATSKTFTASDEPPEFTIEPHQEMSYLPHSPAKLFIYCAGEADHGGGESGM